MSTTRGGYEIAAIVASSNHLRQLQTKLTKTHRDPASRLPVISPVQMRVDDRFSAGALTRGKKSSRASGMPDRMQSEWYPIANPPFMDFMVGSDTRWARRDPQAVYR